MEGKTLTMDEAIIAATLERISLKVNGRAWIEILVKWEESGESERTDEMKAVIAELAHEIKIFVGDKAALSVELPLH